MIVIEKEAEIKLLDELKQVRGQTNGLRFIHYSFSQMEAKQKSLVQELLTTEMINGVLANPAAKTFICEDSDLIIIAPNIFTRDYDQLTIEMYNLCKITNFEQYAKLYDLDNSWPVLYNIAKEKYSLIEQRTQQKIEVEVEKIKRQEKKDILSAKQIDPQLLATIADRRDKRHTPHILVVEDDAFSRKLIRNILSKEYDVIDVEDGQDALQSYAFISPDVVFLDIDLPDVNGHELLAAFQRIDKDAYIIMLSGNSDQENVIKAIKAGAKGFVTKPFVKDRLFSYIEESPTVAAKKQSQLSPAGA